MICSFRKKFSLRLIEFYILIEMRKSFQFGKQKLVLHRPDISKIAKAIKSKPNPSQ